MATQEGQVGGQAGPRLLVAQPRDVRAARKRIRKLHMNNRPCMLPEPDTSFAKEPDEEQLHDENWHFDRDVVLAAEYGTST
ncbi:hypothetical protein LshimejAT787_0110580 [Lyophyllum shimeji]|uniref:Uncharacterized protein n=1 Tax=Lyophyllum shimeji TaxID=47721 RepID=A0A9P3PEM6_LYOSH|nr:hypothetical protein LshimejAT787_0110580 [Lyophyllum shimeji]